MSDADTIRLGKPWPERISIAGLAVDDAKQRLYAVTKENNSLYVIELQQKRSSHSIRWEEKDIPAFLSPDRKTLYASCWGCDKIVIFDTDQQKITGSITVGDNPNDMCITRSGQFLFVANANDNNVSVIDTKADESYRDTQYRPLSRCTIRFNNKQRCSEQ